VEVEVAKKYARWEGKEKEWRKKKIKTNNYKVDYGQSCIETSSVRRVGKCGEMCEEESEKKKYIHETF
jgi:hypothetical protein